MEEKNELILANNTELINLEDENELILKFDKPIEFENEKYEAIDLSKLKELKVKDVAKIQQMFAKKYKKTTVMPELDMDYISILAATITGLPLEFFNQLTYKEGLELKNKIQDFLF